MGDARVHIHTLRRLLKRPTSRSRPPILIRSTPRKWQITLLKLLRLRVPRYINTCMHARTRARAQGYACTSICWPLRVHTHTASLSFYLRYAVMLTRRYAVMLTRRYTCTHTHPYTHAHTHTHTRDRRLSTIWSKRQLVACCSEILCKLIYTCLCVCK